MMNLYKEYPTMICGKLPLRIYSDKCGEEETTIWHFGFPKEIIDPIKDILGTSCYWDEIFDKEDNEFYIVSANVAGGYDAKKLNSRLDFRLKMYNMCLNTCAKMVSNLP